ncbi:DUF4760 domain-containing protein [uncultured Halomonas sp.]|uniref:DUF4760 domain-containing protein n=1 Tax=uncultured Halomonas sp. TaxID=173971 RepID=UPI00262DE9FB|nr:DUF4760 domain-containing protein [uncultured Halomonas sp.]
MQPYLAPIAIIVSVVVSAYFLSRQIRMNFLLSLRNRSFEFSLYSRDPLLKARVRIEQRFGNLFERTEPISIAVIKQSIEEDSQVLSDILTLLAHWENMALAIYSGVADEDVCFEMVAGTLKQHVWVFRSFIEKRKQTNDRAYYYLLKLRRRWEERLSNFTKSEFQRVLPIGRRTTRLPWSIGTRRGEPPPLDQD